ncbi:hypothetical protein [Pseudomonas sp. H9]|uniref:hypothetical protein n=1 Tax=Pseudomonas sp. H9 TaxID=483968 RepID=UPI001057ECAA|nr:hypothetical protein [Pseudomonas sp. H9]TDF81692.1 hypothetical protein E1573_16370 [Pseudomonas sp. H9]
MKEHAADWDVLFAKNFQLANRLVTCSGRINSIGAAILESCDKTKALGSRREAWDTLGFDESIALEPEDREIVSSLPKYVSAIKKAVHEYAEQVERVHKDCTQFRDEVQMYHIPAIVKKVKAVERVKSPTTKDLSPSTMAKVRVQARLSEMQDQLQSLEDLLREVLTASSHFDSAWKSFDVYIDTSQEKLSQITTAQQLARFAIYFGQFLGLWGTIEQSALQMKDKLYALNY